MGKVIHLIIVDVVTAAMSQVVQALKPVHAQIKALRDARMTELESVKSELSTEDYHRARHVSVFDCTRSLVLSLPSTTERVCRS